MDSFSLSWKRIRGFFARLGNKIHSFNLKQVAARTKAAVLGPRTRIPGTEEAQKQIDLDKQLVYSLSRSRIPNFRQLKYLKKYLSQRELWLIRVCLVVFIISASYLAFNFYAHNLQLVPVEGGRYVEGAVGRPQYINPLYADHTDVDSDLASLIYSSLYRRGSNGELVPDLATGLETTEDSKIYTVTLRTDAKWHKAGLDWQSGRRVTADDVVFTFQALKADEYNSSLRSSFLGVEAEVLAGNKVRFILSEPFADFPELLTFGILPSELWKQIPPESALLAELNLKPVGSGPYIFSQFAKDKSGNIQEYKLVANQEYYGDNVLLEELLFRFYPSYEEAVAALNNGALDGISYLPVRLQSNLITPKAYQFHRIAMSQAASVFFNQQSDKLKDKEVRQALAYALDKDRIIDNVLEGNGRKIVSPIFIAGGHNSSSSTAYTYNVSKAGELLASAGWEEMVISEELLNEAESRLAGESQATSSQEADKNTEDQGNEELQAMIEMGVGKWRRKEGEFFKLEIVTVDTPENEQAVNEIKQLWEEIGVKISINLLTLAEIRSSIVDERDYEAFFYSYNINSLSDGFTFWHSSQAESGLSNITGYVNETTDKLLEEARQTQDEAVRTAKYKEFEKLLTGDAPAVFLYSPYYIYPQSKSIKGFAVEKILSPKDRFANISEWYIKTGKRLVWE